MLDKDAGCSGGECYAHEYVINTLERFDKLAEKLTDNQQQIQMSVVSLTENLKESKRLHERVDRLESFMWKVIGGGIAISAIVPTIVVIALKYFGVG